MDLMESTLLAEGITQVIKVIARRDRPIHPDGSSNSGYSFPSGHATVTFAAATVLQQHLGWRAAVPTYLVATYVAMSCSARPTASSSAARSPGTGATSTRCRPSFQAVPA